MNVYFYRSREEVVVPPPPPRDRGVGGGLVFKCTVKPQPKLMNVFFRVWLFFFCFLFIEDRSTYFFTTPKKKASGNPKKTISTL